MTLIPDDDPASVPPVTRHVVCTHPGGLHRMAYHVREPAPERDNGRTVVCVHGLTRNGRDFDVLAGELAARGYRVVCPDLVGRGGSNYLDDPAHYHVGQYVRDCVTLIARLDVERVDWVGTSLGGLVAMTLASLPGQPIERLVINDIGPEVEPAGLDRIRGYVGDTVVHPDFETAEAALRRIMTSFGPHDAAAFRHLSRHHFMDVPGGGLTAHYDPTIAVALQAVGSEGLPSLWALWEAIEVPVLVVRGAQSDILSAATLARMKGCGPGCEAVEFERVGHAPTLVTEDQVAAVVAWLEG